MGGSGLFFEQPKYEREGLMSNSPVVKQELEHLEDIIELLETYQACREPIWPEQLKCLKEAFEAHEVKDWGRCRDALTCFFDYELSDDIWWIAYRAPVYWRFRHFTNWLTMLQETKLFEEPEDSPARVFYRRLMEHLEEQTFELQNLAS